MNRELRDIPIEQLDEPELASRVLIDTTRLEELAESIKLKGVLEPLLVKRLNLLSAYGPLESEHLDLSDYIAAGGRFRVMAGHRRLLASRIAFVKTAPCLVYPADYDDEDMVMLEENMHREDVTAAEQGYWILTLVEKKHLSMPQLCNIFRRSEAWINERVELVRTDAEVSAAVCERKITFAVARQLLRVKEEDHRKFYLGEAIRLELSAASIQYMVDNYKRDAERQKTFAPASPGHLDPGLPAREDSGPHCVLCGTRDASQNMVQVLAHYYHLNPIKKLLRDQGIDWFEQPRE
jgi:ParB family transcriptional regulator, chromosome partitioning protein